MAGSFLSLMKKVVWSRMLQLKSLQRPSIAYCITNGLLPKIITKVPGRILRETLGLPPSEHETQLNQDIFALLMNRFQLGFFLEIGANDGFTFSNTVYLEQEFGWKGVLVEANPRYVDSLSKRTNSVIVNKAISPERGKAVFVDAGLYGGLETCLDARHYRYTHDANRITVDCVRLQEILDQTHTPPIIDFISIDVEGGEVFIIEEMVSVDRRFRCGCCEHNNRETDYSAVVRLLRDAGYAVFWEGQTMQDLFFVDATLKRNRIEKSSR